MASTSAHVFFCLPVFFFAAVSGSNTVLAQESDARLLAEVRGIFAHHCYKCHSSDKQKGDLRLDGREAVFKGGESGAVVVAGKPEESELLRRVRLVAGEDDAMPREGERLDDSRIDILRGWISRGAGWPEEQSETFRRAPLALTKPPIPKADPAPANPVDAFVGRYFADQKVEWPEEAAPAIFVRRVYLDTIGLLPAYRDVIKFERKKDKEGEDKHAALVADLLDRDNDYALHWMTFWNDALRNDYAGAGSIDGDRTPISDWLYLSLARNKPYDVFVRELISPVPGSRRIHHRNQVA